MPEWMRDFFSTGNFVPAAHGYQGQPAVLWIQVLSTLTIACAYVAIAATLGYLVWRGQHLPFKRMALSFGAFIVGGGLTFFMDALMIWQPMYYLDAALRVLTAVASVGTALMLPRLVPQAIALARGASAARERGVALETMVSELGHMYEKARAADVMKTRLFANLSHELRTPLALVLGPTERMVSASNLMPEQRRDLEVVTRNARTLLKHVNDLLDVARIEAGRLQLAYFDVNVAELVRGAAFHFQSVAQERRIHLEVNTPDTLQVQVDSDKVERVLLNLLSNAFKVTPDRGTIRCTVWEEQSQLMLEVSDSGPGVPRAERERIFERFEQLDDGSQRRVGGTGLGLAIVREFVEAHGGTVILDDAPEGGARFLVSLPTRAPAGVVVQREEPVQSGQTRAALDQTIAELQQRDSVGIIPVAALRPRVLVIEDNPEMNQFVRETLSCEFTVVSAVDGAHGLGVIARERPDLVVTDLMMPGISGDELVRTLRARPEFTDLPILVLTAKADEALRVRLLSEGALDYMLKPFSASELMARVRNLVSMKRARDVLQHEVDSQVRDLESLAHELAQQKRELAATLESMRLARDQAEKASRVKSTFLRMVSHELRTPLAAIQLQLDRMARGSEQLPEKHRDLLLRCRVSTRRLARLIESVLDYTRMEGGRFDISRRPFHPKEIASEVLSITQPHAEQKSLALKLHAADSLPVVETDPRLVRLVLLNLVENAVKFTEHGDVEVTVDVTGNHLKLSVRDSGPGIAEDVQPLVFEPFEQIGPTESKHLPGIGLGLALVREMVVALGGRVELQSRIGDGACFTVSLPVRCVEAVA